MYEVPSDSEEVQSNETGKLNNFLFIDCSCLCFKVEQEDDQGAVYCCLQSFQMQELKQATAACAVEASVVVKKKKVNPNN